MICISSLQFSFKLRKLFKTTLYITLQVVVIDKGEIAEEGTHEELLDRNGVYKRLVLRQLTAGVITDPATDKLINQETDSNDHLLD